MCSAPSAASTALAMTGGRPSESSDGRRPSCGRHAERRTVDGRDHRARHTRRSLIAHRCAPRRRASHQLSRLWHRTAARGAETRRVRVLLRASPSDARRRMDRAARRRGDLDRTVERAALARPARLDQPATVRAATGGGRASGPERVGPHRPVPARGPCHLARGVRLPSRRRHSRRGGGRTAGAGGRERGTVLHAVRARHRVRRRADAGGRVRSDADGQGQRGGRRHGRRPRTELRAKLVRLCDLFA